MAGSLTDEQHAVHEAGHAVMAALVGVGVRRVALQDGGGICELEGLPDDPASVRRALLIVAAGDAVEVTTRVPDLADGWRL